MRRSERTSTTTIESGPRVSDTTAPSVTEEALSPVDAALKAASVQDEPPDDKGFLNAYAHISTRKKACIEDIFGISISYNENRWLPEVP